jgi:HPr kinase/phosphorylase
MKSLKVRSLLSEKGKEFELVSLTDELGFERVITVADVNRPGLALAGYTGYFLQERVQIVGQTEVSYLATLSPQLRAEAIKRVMDFYPPCFIVTKGLELPAEFLSEARDHELPVLRTKMDTTPFIHRLTIYLDFKLAPDTYIHGTLVDVYGVGLLIVGESGIGKSECALDLVERGHRLVADDLIRVARLTSGTLIGCGAEQSRVLQHHMEIRGIGIIDVYSIFGIRAIRIQKRVEVQVELVRWQANLDYERVGIEEEWIEILGMKIPRVRVPVVPGKNISAILEVVAQDHLLRLRGYRPAERFNQELMRLMRERLQMEGDIE